MVDTDDICPIHPNPLQDLSIDPENCGECGKSCLGGTCTKSICGLATLATNQFSTNYFVLEMDATDLYWFADNTDEIRTMPRAGGMPSTLTAVGGATTVKDIVEVGSDLYWTQSFGGTDGVWTMPKAGGVATKIHTSTGEPEGIAWDGTYLYWTTFAFSGSTVERMQPDGMGYLVLANMESGAREVDVDNVNVYFTEWYDNAIRKVPVGGGMVTTVTATLGNPWDLLVHGSTVYYADFGDRLGSCDVSGNPCNTALVTNQVDARAVATDGVNIFWVNRGDGRVMQADFDGMNSFDWHTGMTPEDIEVDADLLVWTDKGDDSIYAYVR